MTKIFTRARSADDSVPPVARWIVAEPYYREGSGERWGDNVLAWYETQAEAEAEAARLNKDKADRAAAFDAQMKDEADAARKRRDDKAAAKVAAIAKVAGVSVEDAEHLARFDFEVEDGELFVCGIYADADEVAKVLSWPRN